MRTHLIAGLLLVAPALLLGQSTSRASLADVPRLSEACDKLQEQLRWRISFEEAPVFSDTELRDVIAPTGAHRTDRRLTPLTFEATVPLAPETCEAKQQMMDAMLGAYNKTAKSTYRYFIAGDFIHVVPDQVLGADGKPHPYISLFDTRVSIPRGSYTLASLASEIFNQIGHDRGVTIIDGNSPISTGYYQSAFMEESNGEAARDVLMRALEEFNGRRLSVGLARLRLTWVLQYDPTDRRFWFSVSFAPPETPDKTPKQPAFHGKPLSSVDH